MRILISLDHVYTRTPDGAVWTGAMHDHAYWLPYREVFEEVHVVARTLPSPTPGTLRADGESEWQGWLADIDRLFPQLQDHRLRASWKTQIREPLRAIFTGSDFEPLMAALEALLDGKIVTALAGTVQARPGDTVVFRGMPPSVGGS